MKKELISHYLSMGFPKYIKTHDKIGKKRPDVSKINSKKIGANNPMWQKPAWNHGLKGICKPNSGSFKKGQIPWNKGLEGFRKGIPKPRNSIIPKVEPIPEPLKPSETEQILLEEKRKQQIRLHQLEVEKQEEAEIKAKKDLIDKEFEARIKSGEEKRVRFLPNGEIIEKQMNSTTLSWEPVQPKVEPIIEIPQSIPEIKPILSYDEQLKIALKRVQQNRENNLRQKKSEPIFIEKEDDAYANRISELVGKFGDPEKKEKHYIKPQWKVNPRKKVK